MGRKTGSTQKKMYAQINRFDIKQKQKKKTKQQEKYDETTVQTATKPNDNKYSACGSPFYIVNVGVSGERNLLKIKKKNETKQKKTFNYYDFFFFFFAVVFLNILSFVRRFYLYHLACKIVERH